MRLSISKLFETFFSYILCRFQTKPPPVELALIGFRRSPLYFFTIVFFFFLPTQKYRWHIILLWYSFTRLKTSSGFFLILQVVFTHLNYWGQILLLLCRRRSLNTHKGYRNICLTIDGKISKPLFHGRNNRLVPIFRRKKFLFSVRMSDEPNKTNIQYWTLSYIVYIFI